MKKLLILAFLMMPIFANAQWFTGMSFDINWTNNGTKTDTGVNKKNDNSYGGTISPQFGYKFSDRLLVGTRLNFNFEKKYTAKEATEISKAEKYVTSSFGWDIAPFCRYKLIELGKNNWFSIWADLHGYFGRMYPKSVTEEGYITKSFNRKYIYGIQAMPAVGMKINEKTTIFINFSIVSLAYGGSYTEYDNYSEYTNKLILFTAKLSGLVSSWTTDGLYGFKFGMVRTF